MEYTFHPIGVIRTPYGETSGIPIQGVFGPESKGTVEVFEPFAEGLADIEGFSHLYLIYVFHRSEGYRLKVKPYMDDRERGLFAVRAPKRPNAVGLSVVRLDRREGRILHISEVDMLDETPLLDIKPFVPRFDHRENARVGWMEEAFRREDHRKVSDDRF